MKPRKKTDAFPTSKKQLASRKEELRSVDPSALQEVRGGATAVEYGLIVGQPDDAQPSQLGPLNGGDWAGG